jgi:hypothetical protein
MFHIMNPSRLIQPTAEWMRRYVVNGAWSVVSACVAATTLSAQMTARDIRVEVRDRQGQAVEAAHVQFRDRADSANTDSLGIAELTVAADSLLEIVVSKDGFESRYARFRIGSAPVFIVKVTMGMQGTRLPTLTLTPEYPGEPWRLGFEERRRKSSGTFRDLRYFSGRQMPQTLDEWFQGIPGVEMMSDGLHIRRCKTLGVWIDGLHATGPGMTTNAALSVLNASDIAALELYRTASQLEQMSDPNREDCSLLVWNRIR